MEGRTVPALEGRWGVLPGPSTHTGDTQEKCFKQISKYV